MLPDGRIAYAIKSPRKRVTHRILVPVELLARIAALIPRRSAGALRSSRPRAQDVAPSTDGYSLSGSHPGRSP